MWKLGRKTASIRRAYTSNLCGCIALWPNGRIALSGDEGAADIRVWDVETGRELRRLEGHFATVTTVDISPDGAGGMSASWDGTVRLSGHDPRRGAAGRPAELDLPVRARLLPDSHRTPGRRP